MQHKVHHLVGIVLPDHLLQLVDHLALLLSLRAFRNVVGVDGVAVKVVIA